MARGIANAAARMNPTRTVPAVHTAWLARVQIFCAREMKTGAGPGRRYSGMANNLTVSSQTANTIAKEARVQKKGWLRARMDVD
jgi:hypothetical protein